MTTYRTSIFVATLGTAACASDPNLQPARPTQAVTQNAAESTVAGVEVVAVADAWAGRPDDLPTIVTPIRIMVRNGATVPIAIRYDHIHLETARTNQSHPVPPWQIEGETVVRSSPVRPGFRSQAYNVAPYYGGTYQGMTPTRRSVPYDYRGYYRTYRDYWTVGLPTADMVAKALPEGVIEPGGYVEGFLYFEHFEADEVRGQVTLQFEATNALTGDPAAAVAIPFEVSQPTG